MKTVRAFAPATSANIAVGFDLLGFSVPCGLGDLVTIEKAESGEVTLGEFTGIEMGLSKDPALNTATAGLVKLIKDRQLKFGFRVSIEKGIPMGSGMGGSAASAVAAIVAANECLDVKLTQEQMIGYALIGEAQASGGYHADNVAPSLVGGLTFSRVRGLDQAGLPQVEVRSLPIPADLFCVLVNPALSVGTKEARSILKADIALKSHIEQSANLTGFLMGCYTSDFDLISRSLIDVIIEPQRAHLIPGFLAVKKAAIKTGALGCSISGAGPSIFAWAKGKSMAEDILHSMVVEFQLAGIKANGWAVPLTADGARVIS